MTKPPPNQLTNAGDGEAEHAASPSQEQHPRRRRKLSAIMMTDVTGFSRLMGADEDGTVNLIREFHQRLQALIEQFEGRVVDTAGDSVFGEFDSVVNAVRCARRIQEELAGSNVGRPSEQRIETRIGVHLGDVIVEDYRVYGDGVNIAARLEPLAEPGGICISEAVYQQIRDKLDLQVEDLGMRELKNIQHPIHLYKIVPMSPASARVEPQSRQAVMPTPPPAMPDRAGSSGWHQELMNPATLILMILAVFLFLSPILLFPTAGTLPTAGAVLFALAFGRAWKRVSGHVGNLLIALGFAIASGAVWTDWTRVTNSLFVLGGLIVATVGFHRRRADV